MPVAKNISTFKPAPAGTSIARCFGCVSLGTQRQEGYADTFKLMLFFELPHELIGEDQKPMTITREYSLTLGKKSNLRKHLESWRGAALTDQELQGFEVANVVGKPCQLTIVHVKNSQDQINAKIEGVSGLAKGMTCPEQVHPSIRYEIEDGENNVFKELPEWIQKKIINCLERQEVSKAVPAAATEDNIPF